MPLLVLLLVTSGFAKPKTAVRLPITHHRLEIRFDIDEHRIEGTAGLTLPRKGIKAAGFILNRDFTVSNATLGGIPVDLISRFLTDNKDVTLSYGTFGEWEASDALLWTTEDYKKIKDKKRRKALKKKIKKAFKGKPLILQVDFAGSLYIPPDNRQFSREKIAFEVNGTVGPEGIYLAPSSYWYPTLPDVLSTYEVIARLPDGWNCVTVGMPGEVKDGDGWVEVVHRSDAVSQGISLSAAPFVVEQIDHKGVRIMTYFLPEQAELSSDYIEVSAGFIDMYSEMIDPYPFPKFAVVDNFLPSGYGMPGWTLLGSEVLQLPFIKDISLGHEIAHNWMGNSLYVDYREGNWCEGLTVYLADYKYKEDADSASAVEYRKNQLIDYTNYVTAENDYPVTKFVERSTPADRAIGYGKVMMIFHMLRGMLDQIDKRVFNQVISEVYQSYQWQPIGWSTWRKEFERRMGQRMGWFFDQWLDHPGIPEIAIENVRITDLGGRWDANFEVVTKTADDAPLHYQLLIRAISNVGKVEYQPFIREPRQGIVISGAGDILAIKLDPAYDMFRKVYPGEAPLILSKFYGDPDGVLVIPSRGRHATTYRKIAEGLKSERQRIVTDIELTRELKKHSLWIFGNSDNNKVMSEMAPQASRLQYVPPHAARWREEKPKPAELIFKGSKLIGERLSATIIVQHPDVEGRTLVYTMLLPDANPVESTRKLPHYGKYSYLQFEGDKNVDKGVWIVSGECPVSWQNRELGER